MSEIALLFKDLHHSLQSVNFPRGRSIQVRSLTPAFKLADGFHRWQAARDGGLLEINCDIRQGEKRDAILYSVGANATHGLKRTRADKERAITTLLTNDLVRIDPKTNQPWSDRSIAKLAHVFHETVGDVRRKLFPSLAIPPVRTYVSKHGTVSTMNTANIGKKAPSPTPIPPVQITTSEPAPSVPATEPPPITDPVHDPVSDFVGPTPYEVVDEPTEFFQAPVQGEVESVRAEREAPTNPYKALVLQALANRDSMLSDVSVLKEWLHRAGPIKSEKRADLMQIFASN